jgi:hypothetical protein
MADGVIWCEWSADVFREAEETGKIVFLLLEQRWCPLSRLMDREVWTDARVAEALADGFLCVRVDAARRPDIDRRFRMGAWPSLVFLTPDAGPIAGSTFMPPDVLLNAVGNVRQMMRDKSGEVRRRLIEMERAREAQLAARSDPARKPSPWMLTRVLDMVRESADRDQGGFGGAPKYPRFPAIELLLHLSLRLRDDRLRQLAADAVDAMTQNGLYDWDYGGYFRCSLTADWSAPSMEKLLADQAAHLRLNAWLHRLTGEIEYREAAEGTLEYCRDWLYDPAAGLFSAAQASDVESLDTLEGGRGYLRSADVDRTVFTDANAEMARALMVAGGMLGEDSWVEMGVRTVDALLQKTCQPGGFAFHYLEDGQPQVPGLLQDQAALALACLEACQVTGEGRFLQTAAGLCRRIHDELREAGRPGYLDSADPCGLRRLSLLDRCYEDNVNVAVLFARLARLTGEDEWLERAAAALAAFTGIFERIGVEAAGFGLGLLEIFAEPVLVTLECGPGSQERDDFLRACLRERQPPVLVRFEEKTTPGCSARVRPPEGEESITASPGALSAAISGALEKLALAPTDPQAAS